MGLPPIPEQRQCKTSSCSPKESSVCAHIPHQRQERTSWLKGALFLAALHFWVQF